LKGILVHGLTAVFKLEQQLGRSYLLMRGAFRTEHLALAGLRVGAAISNTSHSNEAGFTTAKRARLTGK
jgi:hypothetical protein